MITVNLDSQTPLEEQICAGIRTALARRELQPGDELPSARQLGGDLGIHWNTVARAYRRLRDDGLVSVGRGRAVRVSASKSRESHEPLREAKVEQLLDAAFTKARLLGMEFDEFRTLVDARLTDWKGAWREAK